MSQTPQKDNEGDSNNLKKQAIDSSRWGFLDKGSNVVAQFIIGIVLARLLPPSDFGLIGLAMIVIGFGQIFVNLGLGPSLIQRQNITDRHIRVVFTTSVLAGLILALIVFYGAPLTAYILESKQVVPVVKVLSIIFVIAGFQITSQSLLKKRLDFRHIFYVSLGKSLFSGIATITLAIMGFGVWSLVIGTILKRLFSFVGSYWFVRHPLSPLLARRELNDLIRFGSGETLSSIANYFALKGDYLMIGKLLGAHQLGLYTKSYSLMQQPTRQFVSVLSDILFPTASKIQKQPERMRRAFIKTMKTIAFLTFPICTLLVLLAPELIVGLYGEKWQGAVAPLQILGIFGIFRALYNASASFLKAKGWVYRLFYSQLVYGILVISGLLMVAPDFGLDGAALTVGIAILTMWMMLMELNGRAMDIPRYQILQTLIPGLIWSLGLTFTIGPLKLLIHQWTSFELLQLIILSPLSIFLGILVCILVPQKWVDNLPLELLELNRSHIPAFAETPFSKLVNFLSQ